MAIENQSRVIFGQTYVFKNPDDSKGPGCWRLCVPGEESCGSGGGPISPIGVFIGIPPITVQSTPDRLTVGFNILDLPSVNSVRSMNAVVSAYRSVKERILAALNLDVFGVTFVTPEANEIKAELPMKITEIADTNYMSHDIVDLSGTRQLSYTLPLRLEDHLDNNYNISSATAKVEVVAEEPVVVTVVGDTATFTFDYTTLPDA